MPDKMILQSLVDAALAVADPMLNLRRPLEELVARPPAGKTVVVGAGKAAASMAAALERVYEDIAPDLTYEGVVVTRYGHSCPTKRIKVIEAAHPVPDQSGREAASEILKAVSGLSQDDRVIALISGGGSALLTAPVEGVSFEEKEELNRALLRSGATIHQMNAVRKHLSAIKGGRLTQAAAAAEVHAFLISDVPGDDLDVIASGPTLPDASKLADARAVVERFGLSVPPSIERALRDEKNETPKPGDPLFERSWASLVATPQASLEAAAREAQRHGLTPVILGDALEGESREVATVMGGMALQVARHGQPAKAPAVLLSGGETTVTVHGSGRGGRNAEFLCALADYLERRGGDLSSRISAVAIDTDGIDGTEDNAGAMLVAGDLERAREQGVSFTAHLENNDGYGAFEKLERLLMTGPTLTNVNDFRAILINP